MVTVPKFSAIEEFVKNLEERYTQLVDTMYKVNELNTTLGLKMEEHLAQQSRMERGRIEHNILGAPPLTLVLLLLINNLDTFLNSNFLNLIVINLECG